MIATPHHRGPDANGIHVSGAVGLAHARLSIIDLQSGAQPMSTAEGLLWITFNGEIFNYVELREELLNKRTQVYDPLRHGSHSERLSHLPS